MLKDAFGNCSGKDIGGSGSDPNASNTGVDIDKLVTSCRGGT